VRLRVAGHAWSMKLDAAGRGLATKFD
jgi:hypothetical protein